MKHYRSKHEGARYPCQQCDYQATLKPNLKTHVDMIHEGIKHMCSQCKKKSHPGIFSSYLSNLYIKE